MRREKGKGDKSGRNHYPLKGRKLGGVVLGNTVARELHAWKRGWIEDSRKDWCPSNQPQQNVLDHARKIRGCYESYVCKISVLLVA
jgi:hypothetical protein